ncbi:MULTISPECIES: hypothetical protein [unclassified Leptolyngbya]|uniref:hypothetical protein n=1 Tax=unclassified Leptolyngbya TaxID=2650499 RepID=UPI001687DA5D|nr:MULTISPECIES: hypothetical protein [unclassified Leptolyngbya]MBD1911349.1 hypothetical protein [Leptolyngbya sp. FACHB-8]MBD2156633.1 hypothetical protein [Leptolyngbya sp. FACHB-16]
MNSQQAQIQELIQSIDAALRKASPRLPWVMAGESEQQRQLLERTRQYLVSLQQANLKPELSNPVPMATLSGDPALGPVNSTASAQSPGESAQQVLQAVLQEVTYLRTNIMQPMRGEVEDLRQRRDSLVSEIRELEAQRQQYALPPQVDTQQQQQALSEFLQSLMGRLQENLTVQVAEMLTTLESRTLPPANSAPPEPAPPADAARFASYIPPLTPQERLDQLQRIQTQSDQLLLKLDTTLRVIFESLQRNIQTYEDSLSQGLDKMHTLGHQGEAIFTALVNRLAQQLGREASQYLQSSLEGTDWQALPGSSGQRLPASSRSDTSSLDSLISELAGSEATILQPPTGMGASSGLSDLNQAVNDLELVSSTPDLGDLDPGEMTMFQVDESLAATRFQDDDMTIFQINEAAIAPLEEIPLDDVSLDNSIGDIDSALELLNQISTELETEDDAADTAPVASPEGIYDELDALYQSLFGADVAPSEDIEPPVDRHIADAEQATNSEIEATSLEAGEDLGAIGDFESQFFEGLADLSAEPAEFSPEEFQLPASGDFSQESNQTIEQLLFDEVPVADGGEQEDTQLLNAERAAANQHMPADVISSLEDLIALSDTAASLDALRSEGSLPEDAYIPASPDEDLLVSEAVVETPRVELQVDEDVLQQLDAELSTLEGRASGEETEEFSFLSDLSADEPEDISTSLEDAFRELPDEEPISPETRLPEMEGDDAFLEEELSTPSSDSFPVEDEPLLEDLLLGDLASDNIEEETLELLEDELHDTATEPEEAAPEDQSTTELPSGPWSAYVTTDEDLLGEPAPEVEALELDIFLTQESLMEDFGSEEDNEQTTDFFPEAETPEALLESLMEDLPLTVFEEENLPPVDDALIDRLIEETPPTPLETEEEELNLSTFLTEDVESFPEPSSSPSADLDEQWLVSVDDSDEQGSTLAELTEPTSEDLDEEWLNLSTADADEQSDILAGFPESTSEDLDEEWLNLSTAGSDEQSDALAELPDTSSEDLDEEWLDLPTADADEQSDALAELTEPTSEELDEAWLNLSTADADEQSDALAELTEPTSEELDEAWLNLSTADVEEQSDTLTELSEATAEDLDEEWLNLSTADVEEQSDAPAELTEPTGENLDEEWLNLSTADADEQSDILAELPDTSSENLDEEEWLNLSTADADEQSNALAELTEPTGENLDEEWLNLSTPDADEQSDILTELPDTSSENLDEEWLNLSTLDADEQSDALAELTEPTIENLDEEWLNLSTADADEQSDALSEFAEPTSEELDEAWLALSTVDTDEQGNTLTELPEPTAEDLDEEWLNLSTPDANEQSDAPAELVEPTLEELDEAWLDLSTADTDEQDDTLTELPEATDEDLDEEWLKLSTAGADEQSDILAELPDTSSGDLDDDLDQAWLNLSTSDSTEQDDVLQNLAEAPTGVTSDEWLDLSTATDEQGEPPEDPSTTSADALLDVDLDLPSQPVELSFEEELNISGESPEPTATSLDEDLFGFGIDLPELTDSAPPPPPLFLEDVEQLSPSAAPEGTIAFVPLEPLLPPDREDLTLEDFQDVMTTPPASIEDLLAEWPDDAGIDPEESPAVNETLPLENPVLPLVPVDTLEATPDTTLELSSDAVTEDTLDSFADALDTAPTPMELAAWFDGVEEIPPAIEVAPPGAQDTSLDDASLFLETFGAEVPPEPSLDDNAFTLDGLGELFESVPNSIAEAPIGSASEPEDTPNTSPAPPLGTDFDQAGIDLYDEELLEPGSEESKKKDLDDRPLEDSVAPIETAPGPVEVVPDAAAPIDPSLDYPSELILQAIGLQADETETNSVALPDDVEPDLALLDLTADLEDEEDEVDPELAALFQRLQRSPLDLFDSEDPLGDRLELLRDQEDDLDSLIFSVTDPLEDDATLFAPPSLTGASKRVPPRSTWYLGIDLGTTGISAVLLHRPTATVYPIFWLELKLPGPIHGGLPIPERTYRLPMAVYVTPTSTGDMEGSEVAIASLTITRQEFSHPTRQPLRDFKSALRVGIPYYTANAAHWEPVLQWSDQRTIPLSTLHQALRALLTSLNYTSPDSTTGSDTSVLSCGAVGLSDDTLQQALKELAGVMVSYPAAWSDTYRFNVREAILAARLVDDPAQIYLVEESTATLLSALAPEDAVTLPSNLTPNPDLFQAHWQGGTLVMNGGASVTELALVNLPEHLQRLSPTDITRRTLPYGGNALDQDIICQLIYPAWVRQANRTSQDRAAILPEGGSTFQAGEDLDWADPWAALGWEHLALPVVGDPDAANRQILQQRLLGAGVGSGLLEAARYLKLTLQQQERGYVTLGGVSLTINRQDLGSRVLLPYIQRLNRELNGLLTQTGIPVLQVNQVLCTGGSASFAAIARWLRQKLPNATIVQDTYTQPEAPQHNHLSICSRVAYGLAAVPLHPQVIDQGHHRYSDYFLLMELLRIFPDTPTTLEGILRMLEQRGIDTHTCQAAIVALLEGHLPSGLVPTDGEAGMLAPTSQHNADYQALLAAPLFVREVDQTYRPNPHQWQVFRRHLDTILATSYQKLATPLNFALDTAQRLQ